MRIPRPCESCQTKTRDLENHRGFWICPGCKAKGEQVARSQREAAELLKEMELEAEAKERK